MTTLDHTQGEQVTSEIDRFFGPKPEVEMPKAQPTHFGRYPARIRAVCDAFLDEMGWNADPTTIRIVAAGAKKFVDVHSDNPELVVRTIRNLRHKARHIYDNIASPGSLITPARKLGKRKEEDRDRYLKGVDDE